MSGIAASPTPGMPVQPHSAESNRSPDPHPYHSPGGSLTVAIPTSLAAVAQASAAFRNACNPLK
jgi:hypothetical protein